MVYDFLGMDATSPNDVIDALPSDNEDLEVIINSGGGDVYSGSEIYTTLKAYPGKVNVKVVGVRARSVCYGWRPCRNEPNCSNDDS